MTPIRATWFIVWFASFAFLPFYRSVCDHSWIVFVWYVLVSGGFYILVVSWVATYQPNQYFFRFLLSFLCLPTVSYAVPHATDQWLPSNSEVGPLLLLVVAVPLQLIVLWSKVRNRWRWVALSVLAVDLVAIGGLTLVAGLVGFGCL